MTYRLERKRSGSGFLEIGLAGENLGARKLVYRDNSGIWRLADSDSAATMPGLGITTGAISQGRYGRILTLGYVGDSAWTWTPGLSIFATGTPGEISQTVPSVGNQQIIGYAAEPDLIFFLTRQIRGMGTAETYTFLGKISVDQFGLPNLNPPSIVDQDNVTLYKFDVDTDAATVKFPTPVNYVSGPMDVMVMWTNDGGVDDNGKNVKVQMSYQVAGMGDSIAGSHTNSPKTVEDTYTSASGWIAHGTEWMSISGTDFGASDLLLLHFMFVTPVGTALTCDPHMLCICIRYLATPDR